MTQQIYWQANSADILAGKLAITSGLCLRRSEVLRSLNTTYGHKAKDITPSNAWRTVAQEEEELDTLP